MPLHSQAKGEGVNGVVVRRLEQRPVNAAASPARAIAAAAAAAKAIAAVKAAAMVWCAGTCIGGHASTWVSIDRDTPLLSAHYPFAADTYAKSFMLYLAACRNTMIRTAGMCKCCLQVVPVQCCTC